MKGCSINDTVSLFLTLKVKQFSISQVPYIPSSFGPDVILLSELNYLALPFILPAVCPFLATSQSNTTFCLILVTGLHLSSDIWVVCVNLLRSVGTENLGYFGAVEKRKKRVKLKRLEQRRIDFTRGVLLC